MPGECLGPQLTTPATSETICTSLGEMPSSSSSSLQSPLPWIKGLKWGEYVGSPCTPDPVVCFSQPHGERFGSLLALPTRAICGLSHKFCLMMIYSKEQGRDSLSRPSSPPSPSPCPADSINTPLGLRRRPQHAQHRHPVVGHPELGLRRQHTETEEQAERAANQLHPVFPAPPGRTTRPASTLLSPVAHVRIQTLPDWNRDPHVYLYSGGRKLKPL